MSDKFDKYNRFKIQQKVADLLGMDVEHDDDTSESTAIIPVPDIGEIVMVDNPELPDVTQELIRLEHSQRKREVLADRGEQAALNLLNDLDKTPPMYKPKTALAAAEFYKAVADLRKSTIKDQLDIIEAKLKMAAFLKNKSGAQSQTITGNTIIFNREDLIKQFGGSKPDLDDEGDD